MMGGDSDGSFKKANVFDDTGELKEKLASMVGLNPLQPGASGWNQGWAEKANSYQ